MNRKEKVKEIKKNIKFNLQKIERMSKTIKRPEDFEEIIEIIKLYAFLNKNVYNLEKLVSKL